MQIHNVAIVCEGARAALGRLDGADVPEVTLGVQRLLTASALFYTEARVPREAEPTAPCFGIEGGSPGGEPWTYEAWIRVRGSEVYDATSYTFKDHLVAVLQAWERGTPFCPPEFVRTHSRSRATLYSSIWDAEPPLRTEFVRLSERVAQAMELITRPCTRSACSLRLVLDGTTVLSVPRRSAEVDPIDTLPRCVRMKALA